MAKFNRTTVCPAVGNGPIVAEATPSTVTSEGGQGYLRVAKSELFLLAEANMRSAPLVAAAEAVHARLAAGVHGANRELVAGTMARADEPGEFLAYWTSRFGRAIPKPVKRGVADAVRRLYTPAGPAEVRHGVAWLPCRTRRPWTAG